MVTVYFKITVPVSVADPDPGSEIQEPVLFYPWIRDPDPGLIFSGSRISDPGSKGYVFW
jgi:hypothetical protein